MVEIIIKCHVLEVVTYSGGSVEACDLQAVTQLFLWIICDRFFLIC